MSYLIPQFLLSLKSKSHTDSCWLPQYKTATQILKVQNKTSLNKSEITNSVLWKQMWLQLMRHLCFTWIRVNYCIIHFSQFDSNLQREGEKRENLAIKHTHTPILTHRWFRIKMSPPATVQLEWEKELRTKTSFLMTSQPGYFIFHILDFYQSAIYLDFVKENPTLHKNDIVMIAGKKSFVKD